MKRALPFGCSLWIFVLIVFTIIDMGWFSLSFVGVFLLEFIFIILFYKDEGSYMRMYGRRAVRDAKVKLKLIRKFKRKSRFVKDKERAMQEFSLMNNIPYNIFSRWMDCVKDVKRKKLEPLVKDSVEHPNEIVIRYVDDSVKKREPSRKSGKAGTALTITARESNNKNESIASDNRPMSEEEYRQEIKRLKEENERLKRKLKENK